MQTHALQTSTPTPSLPCSDKEQTCKKTLLELEEKLVCLITQITIKHSGKSNFLLDNKRSKRCLFFFFTVKVQKNLHWKIRIARHFGKVLLGRDGVCSVNIVVQVVQRFRFIPQNSSNTQRLQSSHGHFVAFTFKTL